MAKRTSYDPYDHFILRAPLLPLGLLSAIPASDGLRAWLNEIWDDPVIQEGIELGSFDFSELIGREFNPANTSHPDQGIELALLRYICRFASRCTPFGTFAGFAAGKLDTETSISLGEKTGHHLHVRPDMEYLMRIARMLESDPEIRESLLFTGNTSLYRVGQRWHYIEIHLPPAQGRKIYDIVTIDDIGVVAGLINFCRCGKRLPEIRNYLIILGWQEPEVNDFVDSLVESQVIVSVLEPVVCGKEYIDSLISELSLEFRDHPVVNQLVELKDLIGGMVRPSTIRAHRSLLDSVLFKIPVKANRNHLIQVDMKLESSCMTIDSQLTGQVLLGLRILKALSSQVEQEVNKGFREGFLKRYGDRKVQLIKALDPETGIGMEGAGEGYWTDPVPWLDDLGWGPPAGQVVASAAPGNRWLAAKGFKAIRDRKIYIDIDTSDLPEIGIHNGKWPDQMTAMFEVFEPGLPGPVQIHLLLGSTGNPAYLLGRFGFADSGLTMEWIRKLIADQQAANPELVFAEVVHLPEDRTGNVLQRPAFLDFEIPYLARSVKGAENQILISDVMVSVVNQRIELTSAITGRTIVPMMTNAYNHQLGNLSVYKFLHRIGYQYSGHFFGPDWGDAFNHASFIPGIRFKNLIITSPEWVVRCDEIAGFIDPGVNSADVGKLIAWKTERQMPDEMVWISSDQELYFNWNHQNLVLALWDAVRNLSVFRVRPFYLSNGTPVKSPDGSHANQFVICFHKS